jgi:5,5'-dehydrodivanillate O-demethylase
MPAEDASFPPKVKIRSYPTEEYLGLIFAYLGDAGGSDPGAFGPPPLPRFRDLEGPGVQEPRAYVTPCNYFQNIENGPDFVHVAFTHRDLERGYDGLPRQEAEETAYGMAHRCHFPDGKLRLQHHLMPNLLRNNIPPQDPAETDWRDCIFWRVPIDDERHWVFAAVLVHVTGDAAEEYQARRQSRPVPDPRATEEAAAAVLRGELRADDLVRYPRPIVAINAQDFVAQAGQGRIADRERERLGRSDVAVIALRQLWTRELQAVAAGQPVTPWTYPERLVALGGY